MNDALGLVDWDSVSLVVVHGEGAPSTESGVIQGVKRRSGSRERLCWMRKRV